MAVTLEKTDYVYVRERNGLKIVLGGVVAITFAATFLFAVGFAMSFVGFRPPTFDARILEDQWAKRIGNEPVSYETCVEKKGRVSEGVPGACEYEGQVYIQAQAQ